MVKSDHEAETTVGGFELNGNVPVERQKAETGILSQWFENLIRKLKRAGGGFDRGGNNVYRGFTDRSVQNKLTKDLTQDRCRVLMTGEKIAV